MNSETGVAAYTEDRGAGLWHVRAPDAPEVILIPDVGNLAQSEVEAVAMLFDRTWADPHSWMLMGNRMRQKRQQE